MTYDSGGYRIGARVTYMSVRSNGIVDALSYITNSFVRLDTRLGPYVGAIYPASHLACHIKDFIS